MNTHTVNKPHEYDICKKSFSQWLILKILKNTHNGEKLYEYIYWKKNFSQLQLLKLLKITHRWKKPYEFHICKRSSKSHNLKVHKNTHIAQ
jgi:KRAB domain-containing zinc finger protein